MSKSKPSIPKKRRNPVALEVALANQRKAMVDSMSALDNLTKMVVENCRILGQLVVMFEILKDKGIITNEEIEQKFKDLEEKRKEAEAKKEADAKEEWNKERQALADQSNDKDTETPKETEGEHNSDSEDPKGSTIQPEKTGDDENNSGDGGQ